MPNDPYVFPGVPKFFEAAAVKHGVQCRDMLNKARKGWFAEQITNVLGDLMGLVARVEARQVPGEALDDALANLRALQAGSRIQADALDAAVEDVLTGLGLTTTTTTTTTGRPKRAANR